MVARFWVARFGVARFWIARFWALCVLGPVIALPAGAAAAPAEGGAPTVTIDGASAPEAEPAAPSPNADATLERVLRSGCRDGLDELRALRGDPSAPWADTVARLCGDVLRRPAVTTAPRGGISETASANEGRGRLVLWSSLYGVWLGIASDVLFDLDGDRQPIIPPLLGMGAALGASLALTADHPLTTGQAWTIITGLDYASLNGALWGGALGLSAKGVVGTSIGTSLVATGVATWVAVTQRPKAGDIELVRSSLLWGTTAGLLGVAALGGSDVSAQSGWRGGAIAMDVGLLAGLALASNFDLSRNRVLIIDAGAVGGGLAGLGITWLILGSDNVSGHTIAGGALGGLIAGIAIAAVATRHLDVSADQARAPSYPALFARGGDGHWTVGFPAPTPVLNGAGTRPVGASLAAVGGVF